MWKFNVKQMMLIALFTAFMVVGAYIRIPNPFFPVYFTFQTVFCALAGILIGSKSGAAAMVLYVAMGLAGLPVFSTPAGPQYIFQPSFGFLLGFIAAAWIMGKFSESSQDFTIYRSILASLSGLLAIYCFGISYIYFLNNVYTGNPVGFFALIASMSMYFLKDLILFIPIAVFSPQIKKRIY